MNIQQLTCTVEQGKKLRELGVTTNSLFVAALNNIGQIHIVRYCVRSEQGIYFDPLTGKTFSEYDTVNLYNLGELLRMCATESHVSRDGSYDSEYPQWQWVDEGGGDSEGMYAYPEKAAANMLIWQLENGRVTAEQCNSVFLNQ